MNLTYKLTFITPLFSKGCYDNQPEIRPASIRGQLHWWFRALGNTFADEKAIFGSIHGQTASSKIVIRVSNIHATNQSKPTLPHKQGGQAAFKQAFAPSTSFELHILTRRDGLTPDLQTKFLNALNAWLLCGTLGLRGTRAAGSFTFEPIEEINNLTVRTPQTLDAYSQQCAALLNKNNTKFCLISEPYNNPETARIIISDTIGGRPAPNEQQDLAGIRHPLGKIHQGRKTSPLRFRIVQIAQQHHILAIWDNRAAVTGNQPGDLVAGVNLLVNANKTIGTLLKNANFQ